jgi:hypothetical protein
MFPTEPLQGKYKLSYVGLFESNTDNELRHIYTYNENFKFKSDDLDSSIITKLSANSKLLALKEKDLNI